MRTLPFRFTGCSNACTQSARPSDYRLVRAAPIGGGAGNRTRVRAGSFRSSTCVAVLSLSRPPRFVRHFAVAAQSLFGFPPAPVTGAIGESPNDVRPQLGDALG